jgi:hypothetical protein
MPPPPAPPAASAGTIFSGVIDLTGSDSEDEKKGEEGPLTSQSSFQTRKRKCIDNSNSSNSSNSKPEIRTQDTTNISHTNSNYTSNDHINSIRTREISKIDIDRTDGDNGIISSNIELPSSHDNILTCAPSISAITTSTSTTSTSNAVDKYTRLTHVKQNDKWSCGFRNVQMILSFLLPNIATDHPLVSKLQNTMQQQTIQNNSQTARNITLPSIHQIQSQMEQSWKEGFDAKGAHHFSRKIRSKKSQIGAMEAHGLLSFWNIDSTVVQFVLCLESKEMLGKFVKRYFDPCARMRNCFMLEEVGSRALVDDLMEFVEGSHGVPLGDEMAMEMAASQVCDLAIAPLYLQWEGHSVTIVGIELLSDRDNSSFEYNLLVLDPGKKMDDASVSVSGAKGSHSHAHIHALPAGMDRMKLSSKKIKHKDHQIIVVSTKGLCPKDREERKRDENSAVVTAALRRVEEVKMAMSAAGYGYS